MSTESRTLTGERALGPGTRLQFLPGIGPARARLFERLGISTLEHLLRHYPRTYLDVRRFVTVKDLKPGEPVTVRGTVKSAAAVRTRAGRTDFSATLGDGTGVLACYFFGQGFLARTLRPGTPVVVSGEIDGLERRMLNPMFEASEADVEELLNVGRMVPVHALTAGLTARVMRRAVRAALDAAADRVADPVPEGTGSAPGPMTLGEALRQIHFPADDAGLAAARRRLVFEELFLLQTVLELRRRALGEADRTFVRAGRGLLAGRAVEALPWPLTGDQCRALDEIVADLKRPIPMHRMLLGDVGSGKTVVAYLAALHVIESGHPVAFMTPTEILSRQHGETLTRLARAVGIPIAVLTASTPAAERREIADRLRGGEALIAIGTHALIEAKIEIPTLGLAIVDEQHRFGVRQRARLAQKGGIPDLLVLTATPIPRTLTLACFGDLDVSTLRARPPGRGRLVTRIAGEEKFPQVLEFMAGEIAAGRQAYVVVPMIEETGRLSVRAAEAEFERLRAQPALRAFRIELLHGRLKPSECRAVMDEFAAGRVQALVATTVIEVGVDVPNATLMVVENADRFGLTQLHQLRGRVGRGAHRSVCVLIAGPDAGPRGRERLEVLARLDDGFAIAEEDLRLRGPGELWGTRQSGLPRLKLADLSRDEALLEEAREAARETVGGDPHLLGSANAALRSALLLNYAEPLEFALTG
ncbi:MAG: ATP-dependent DNA helicase RecG [Candidatus Eisenbacteria bacterium]|nr:ATP-dependent DNA helicase RecG [Candidatus Eisenbacteria bacterium]